MEEAVPTAGSATRSATGSATGSVLREAPRIPDEWKRNNSKTVTKNVRFKHSNPESSTQPMDVDSTAEPLPLTGPEAPATKKRRRVVVEAPATDTQTQPTESSSCRTSEETESVLRGLYSQVEKLAQRPGCALSEGIYLDSIMTHIPYVDVLQQMFGGDSANIKPCVPLVTRAYEESYMREATGCLEESCIMGSNCECQFVDEHNPFIGVQFTLPIDILVAGPNATSTDKCPDANKLCVLCCRKNTQTLFYDSLYNYRTYNGCIQLYGNICDRPGEYATEAMLICPLTGPINNMPLPVVAHQRNRYSVVTHNGLRQLRQHRVGYEDFHTPSSSRC